MRSCEGRLREERRVQHLGDGLITAEGEEIFWKAPDEWSREPVRHQSHAELWRMLHRISMEGKEGVALQKGVLLIERSQIENLERFLS